MIFPTKTIRVFRFPRYYYGKPTYKESLQVCSDNYRFLSNSQQRSPMSPSVSVA